MRNEVVEFLIKKIEAENPRMVFLTGDLGFSVLEPLQKKLGDKFINAGIAEALMTTLAATFATYGYKAFTYSITPFATLRCLEQIRNDVCYHNLDVTVIGIGAGFGYGSLGPTHHATEDLAAVWSLPNISVYNPADLNEAFACFAHAYQNKGPKYLRLSKGGDGYLSKSDLESFQRQKVVEYSSGTDLTILSTGNILSDVLRAKDTISAHGKCSVQVLSCPILKPFPDEELANRISSRRVLIVEEVSRYGGFSSQASQALMKFRPQWVERFDAVSPKDQFSKRVGSSDFQRQVAGIGYDDIVAAASNLLS